MTLHEEPESAAANNQTLTFMGIDSGAPSPGTEWWRSAVIYQIYPRSFADSNGDGLGDLPGITSRLDSLVDLGIDAIWLSPFFTSPQRDAGYDVSNYQDVDPIFGTLADFDALLAASHARGIRIIVDLVPNHTSSDHAWFQAALASPEGSPERDRYIFRDGSGENGEMAPNNWESVFGGSMWTRTTRPDGTAGQWYLHIFDSSQPDLNWENAWVREQFVDILRFWLDRGVDGFRVDVAHGLIKEKDLPNYTPPATTGSMGGGAVAPHDEENAELPTPPYWAQEGVHEIYRQWNRVLKEYDGERVLCAEAWVEPLHKLAHWVRPDEMHQAFNFSYLSTDWSAPELRTIIDQSIDAFSSVGAPSTWVLSNHDVIRHATRLCLEPGHLQGDGIGARTPRLPNNPVAGLRRARAATALMLALPGSAYLYQGEELGLPESIYLPDEARQDPTWFRTKGERYGRDGCRVPLPWEAGKPSYGFGPGEKSWLPQPTEWADFSRDSQTGVAESTLELYKKALLLRKKYALGHGKIEWLTGFGSEIIAFRNGPITVLANTGTTPIALPPTLLLRSSPDIVENLPADSTVWFESSSDS